MSAALPDKGMHFNEGLFMYVRPHTVQNEHPHIWVLRISSQPLNYRESIRATEKRTKISLISRGYLYILRFTARPLSSLRCVLNTAVFSINTRLQNHTISNHKRSHVKTLIEQTGILVVSCNESIEQGRGSSAFLCSSWRTWCTCRPLNSKQEALWMLHWSHCTKQLGRPGLWCRQNRQMLREPSS